MKSKAQFITGSVATIGLFALLTSPVAPAQDVEGQTRQRNEVRQQEREQVYASELMTSQERAAYQTRIRNAASEAERDQVRAEHQALMQNRAREQGLTLGDESATRRRGTQETGSIRDWGSSRSSRGSLGDQNQGRSGGGGRGR